MSGVTDVAGPWQRLRWRLSEARAFLLAGFDAIALRLLRRGQAARLSGKPSVAVFLLHGAGDLVLALPCLRQIRQRYPGERFHLVLYCQPSAVELAGRFAPADEIVEIDRHRIVRSLAYRLQVLTKLAARRHALALQPTFNRMLAVEDCLMRATMAEERLGSGGSKDFLGPIGRRLGNRWYHHLTSPADQPMHELDRYAEFLAGLGWPNPPPTLPDLSLPPAKSALAPGYLLIIPDASSPLKSWPMAKFEALACALADGSDRPIVIAARKAIEGFGQQLVPLRGRQQLVDMSGQTSIMQFLTLIRDAGLVITNDSAGLHFAVALGRPTLAIAGGGLPERYHPYPAWADARLSVVERRLPCYGCSWRCIYNVAPGSPAPCIGDIEVSDVMAALARAGMPGLRDQPLARRARSAI